jgi:hypothetical protein
MWEIDERVIGWLLILLVSFSLNIQTLGCRSVQIRSFVDLQPTRWLKKFPINGPVTFWIWTAFDLKSDPNNLPLFLKARPVPPFNFFFLSNWVLLISCKFKIDVNWGNCRGQTSTSRLFRNKKLFRSKSTQKSFMRRRGLNSRRLSTGHRKLQIDNYKLK